MKINIKKVKIIVGVPKEYAELIKQVLGDAGAGIIGNYTYCSLATDCIGSFKGNDKSNPFIGDKNQLETVDEVRIEVSCEIENTKFVLERLKEVHPYEEPVIDIVPLMEESDL